MSDVPSDPHSAPRDGKSPRRVKRPRQLPEAGDCPPDAPHEAPSLPKVTLYCDGACRGNPGVGGYAAILQCDGREKELSGAVSRTTNNRMELTAAISGLSALKERCRVRIVTDSQYLKNGMTEWIHSWRARGWKTSGRKDVLNRDLWERLAELCDSHLVEWEWTRGHAGDEHNERCDRLANEAIEQFLEEST